MRYGEIMEQGLAILREAGIEHWLNLGAETQSQNRLNREYMDRLTFELRLLGSVWADTRATLFGVELPAPILPSALTSSRVIRRLNRWDEPWLELFAAGVADAGSIMMVGQSANDEFDRILDRGARVIRIVKPHYDNDEVLRQIRHAEDKGAVAIGIDFDAMFLEKAFDEKPGPDYLADKTIEEYKMFRAATRLLFIMKGVLSVQDALIARDEIKADCIMVSNHGGETIDYTVPILKILPDIKRAAPDLTILVDSGFRRGSDVFKALALGADGVCFVTTLLVAFVANGSQGVTDMLRALQDELKRVMTLTGCKSLSAIDPSIIHAL